MDVVQPRLLDDADDGQDDGCVTSSEPGACGIFAPSGFAAREELLGEPAIDQRFAHAVAGEPRSNARPASTRMPITST